MTEGVEAAVEQAREAADGRDVAIAGGADVIQQCLRAGLVHELQLHVVPLLLGAGTRLFGRVERSSIELTKTRVIDSPRVTHLGFQVATAAP